MKVFCAGEARTGDWRYDLFSGLASVDNTDVGVIRNSLKLGVYEYGGPFIRRNDKLFTYPYIKESEILFIWLTKDDPVALKEGLYAKSQSIPVFVAGLADLPDNVWSPFLSLATKSSRQENVYDAWKWFAKSSTELFQKRVARQRYEKIGGEKRKGFLPMTVKQRTYLVSLLKREGKRLRKPMDDLSKDEATLLISLLVNGKSDIRLLREAENKQCKHSSLEVLKHLRQYGFYLDMEELVEWTRRERADVDATLMEVELNEDGLLGFYYSDKWITLLQGKLSGQMAY